MVNEVLAGLKVEKYPDKTFIGKAERGFDFLGYFLTPGNLAVAEKTVANTKERITRLYEQGADVDSIGQYVRRWLIWVRSGLRDYMHLFNIDAIRPYISRAMATSVKTF